METIFCFVFFPLKKYFGYIQKSRNIYWWYEEMSDLIKTWMPWKYRYISFYRNTFLTPINYPKVVLKSELAAYIYRMIYSFPYVNFLKCQKEWILKCQSSLYYYVYHFRNYHSFIKAFKYIVKILACKTHDLARCFKILRENTQIQNLDSLHSLVMNQLHALACVMNPICSFSEAVY